MSGCLTVSHTYLPCPPSEKTLPFWKLLLLVGSKVSWKRWESSELERWEKCVGGVRCQGGKGEVRCNVREVQRLERWERNDVAI